MRFTLFVLNESEAVGGRPLGAGGREPLENSGYSEALEFAAFCGVFVFIVEGAAYVGFFKG